MTDIQTLYQETIRFAAGKHGDQKVKGTEYSYVVHLSNVAMELFMAHSHANDFDLPFAIQVALLHDTIEDTDTSRAELEKRFGKDVEEAVWALTKADALPKKDRMKDCLEKIKPLRKEVWAVKLADRITNLQLPPQYWTAKRVRKYQDYSRVILSELEEGNKYLAERLKRKIEEYDQYLET
jgi:guanosine-3',5'-bis(diphosphate) 3'-pyrophosphohydrolase